MKELKLTSNSSNDTIDIAKKLAKYLKKGDTVVLSRRAGFW